MHNRFFTTAIKNSTNTPIAREFIKGMKDTSVGVAQVAALGAGGAAAFGFGVAVLGRVFCWGTETADAVVHRCDKWFK